MLVLSSFSLTAFAGVFCLLFSVQKWVGEFSQQQFWPPLTIFFRQRLKRNSVVKGWHCSVLELCHSLLFDRCQSRSGGTTFTPCPPMLITPLLIHQIMTYSLNGSSQWLSKFSLLFCGNCPLVLVPRVIVYQCPFAYSVKCAAFFPASSSANCVYLCVCTSAPLQCLLMVYPNCFTIFLPLSFPFLSFTFFSICSVNWTGCCLCLPVCVSV